MNTLPDYYSPRGTSLKEMLEQQNADQMKSGERGRVLSRDAYLAQQRKYKGPGVNSPRGVVGQETLPILPTKPSSATLPRRVEAKEPRPHTSRGPGTQQQQQHQQELVDPTSGPYVSPRQRSGVPLTADFKSYQRDLSKHSMSNGVDVGYGSSSSAIGGRLHVSNTSGKVLMPDRTSETMAARQHASRYNNNNDNQQHYQHSGNFSGGSIDGDDDSSTQPGTTCEGITTPTHGNRALVVVPTPPPIPPPHDHHHTSVIRYSLEHPTQLEVNRSVLSDSINELCGILSEYRELRIGLSEEERDKLIDLSGLANWNELQQLSGGAPLLNSDSNIRGDDINNNATGGSSGSGGGPNGGGGGDSSSTPMSPLLWHLYNRASVLGIASQPLSYASGEANERSYIGSGSATPYLPPSYTDRTNGGGPPDWRLNDAVSPPLPTSTSNMLNINNGGGPQQSRATAPTPPSSMSVGRQEDTNAVLGSPRPPRPLTPACTSRGATGNTNNNNGVTSSSAGSINNMSTTPIIPSVPADMVDWMCTTCQDMLASDLPMATILNALVEQVQQSVPEVYTINVWVYSSSHNMLYRLDNERVHTAPLDPEVPAASSSSSGNQRIPSSRGRRPVSRLLDSSHSKIQSPADTSVDSTGGTTSGSGTASGPQRPTSGFGDDSSSTEALIMSTFLSKVPKADSARIVMPLFITPTTNTPSLPTRDGVFGVLEILGSRGSELNLVDASQSAILCSVGSFVYSILHHRRQRERYNRKVQSVDSVVQIANQLANVTNLDENKLVRDIMAVAMNVCEAERSAIFLPSSNGDGSLSEMVAHGSDGQTLRVPQGYGIVGHVAETGVGMNVDDAYSCPYFYEEADRTNNFTTKAILCLPVHYEGSIVAVAELLNKKTKSNGGPSTFTREDEEHFENLMTLVGLCLRNCKKSHELIVEKAKIEALFASVLEISSTDITKLNAVLSGIVDTACTLGYPVFNFAFVLRYDVELQELLVDSNLFPTNRRTMHPSNSKSDVNDMDDEAPPPNPPTLKRYPPGKGVAGLCYTTGEVQLALNLSSDTPFDPEVDVPFLSEKEANSVSALLSIPLISGKDVIGILQFVRVEDPAELVDVMHSQSNEHNESKAVMAVVNPSTLGRPQSSGSSASRVATPQTGQRPPRGGSASSRTRTQDTTTGGAWLTLRQSPVPVDRWSNPSPSQQPIAPTLPKGIRPPGRHSSNRPHLVPTSHTEKGLSLVYDWDDISGPSDELISLLKGFAVFAAIWIHNADLIDFTVKAGKAATKLSTVFRSKRPGARAQFHVDRSEVNLVLRTAVPDAFIHSISSPDFNLWSVRQSADIAPLLVASRVVFDLMWSTGLPQKFGCREETLATFIVACRSKYRPVPYHNFFHAVDVTQTIFHYMYTGGASELLTPLEQFVALVVGLTHDLDHMGLNNNYHMKTDTPLGILSAVGGSQSVLEVRHCNLAVEILSAEESNIFEGLSKEDVTTAYHLLIEAILGTDMAKHAACIHQLREWDPASFDFEKPDHRKFAFGVVVKVADVSNISKPFEISKKWAVAVTEEFSQQGDSEKSQGISDILPLFDREKNADLAKGQLGFIQFVAEPFYKLVVEKLFPGMQYALDNIHHNVATWKQLQQN